MSDQSATPSNAWITDWTTVDDKQRYIVFPVQQQANHDDLYLGRPELMFGWQLKRLMSLCYVALPLPAFDSSVLRKV